MKTMQEITDATVLEEQNKSYDEMIRTLQEAKENGTPIDEGIFKAVVGGLAGVTVGPAIMKGVCHVLGIDEKGTLGNLMTSRLVLTALASYLGYKN